MFAVTSRSALRASSVRIASATRARFQGTRLYSSTKHDNDKEHKNPSGAEHKSWPLEEVAPGWNEVLATPSEADVKADKVPLSPSELQSSTVEYLRVHRSESEGENNTASTTAFYARDEVSGPLSGVQGKEGKGKGLRGDESAEELEEIARMTESEEDVKADRGEV